MLDYHAVTLALFGCAPKNVRSNGSLETYFAGRDICRLPTQRIRETLGWVVDELVAASLRE